MALDTIRQAFQIRLTQIEKRYQRQLPYQCPQRIIRKELKLTLSLNLIVY